MNLTKYNFTVDKTGCSYEFVSIGPKGAIKKVVHYIYHPQLGENVYNLGFGDWDDVNMKVNDTAVSNNGDTLKILATVAATAMHFTKIYHDAWIFFEGSTSPRTRLYQKSLSLFFQEISILFHMYGLKEDGWEIFNKGVNYKAFLVLRR